jgi:hypothetical protein
MALCSNPSIDLKERVEETLDETFWVEEVIAFNDGGP